MEIAGAPSDGFGEYQFLDSYNGRLGKPDALLTCDQGREQRGAIVAFDGAIDGDHAGFDNLDTHTREELDLVDGGEVPRIRHRDQQPGPGILSQRNTVITPGVVGGDEVDRVVVGTERGYNLSLRHAFLKEGLEKAGSAMTPQKLRVGQDPVELWGQTTQPPNSQL